MNIENLVLIPNTYEGFLLIHTTKKHNIWLLQ